MESSVLTQLYRHSLALLTDLYQLTMAYGYFRQGMAEQEAVFHLFFRENPFGGGFTIACGLQYVLDFLRGLRFSKDDLAYLSGLRGNDGQPLFDDGFIEHLRRLRFCCDLDAVPEGTVVFPGEPLLRVRGPLIPCQILETPLLNMINFQSLIATRAARICRAVRGEPVLEFGLRRAQGIDGALAAARAAYVGGCAATSNLLAGRLFGIPVRGTHAHSWVMAFDREVDAFEAYAQAMPNNCVFLVDTYDTLDGLRNAVQVGTRLRERGHEMVGVRLDSGELAGLSIQARRILDEGGFPDALIVASNDLDEQSICALKERGARIGVWGVGTRLITAYGQPALGGVYKLAALRRPGGPWQYKLKLSEQPIKVSNPGLLQVRRFLQDRRLLADAIFDLETRPRPEGEWVIVDPLELERRRTIPAGLYHEDLLVKVMRGGRQVYEAPSLSSSRQRAMAQLELLGEGLRRLRRPEPSPVGLELGLSELKQELGRAARALGKENP